MSRFINTLLGSTIGVLVGVGSAFGNPSDPTVVAGSASFETLGSQLNVTNASGTIIDWNRFSIGRDEITKFIQESSSSVVLNRVTGGNMSEILGGLQSNGRVFLINSNGLIVGQDAVIDTAGFVASTLGISNDSFSSGEYSFNGDGGTIENRGLIHVSGNGDIALIATSLENSGVLRSDNGDILLAAGRSVSLSFDEFQNMSFDVQAPSDHVVNLGDVIAKGGNVSMVGGRINNTGNIELVESADGRIFLQATDVADVSGSLKSNGGDIHLEARQLELRDVDVSSSNQQTAGDISLLGDNVGLFSGAKVDASANQGGGEVLVGGEQQGRGDTRTSEFVYLDSNASVSADGGVNGDGGRVILFAENTAKVHGDLTARGGTESGDGGFIETSGLLGLAVTATPNAGADNGADNGAAGTWLIDPHDITIEALGGPEAGTTESPTGVFTADTDGAVIFTSTIETALNTSDVVIDTGTTGSQDGNISIMSDISFISGNTLTFNAAGDIVLSVGVTLTADDGNGVFFGSLIFNSDTDMNGVGTTRLADANSIQADFIEFNGGGVSANGVFDSLFVNGNNLTVNGGLNLIESEININIASSTIDEINLVGGDASGGAILAGLGNVFTVGSLNVTHAAPGTLPMAPTILVDGTYTLTGDSDFNIAATTGGSPLPGGQVEISADIINDGTLSIAGEGQIDIGFLFGMPSPNGSLTNNTNGILNLEGGVLVGTGSMPLVNNGVLNATMASVAGPFADLIDVFGTIENNNVINVNPGSTLQVTSLTLNQGEIHLEDGGILRLFDEPVPMSPVPVDLSIGDGSSITGNGLIETDGVVSVEAGGILAPGNSPGSLLFNGNVNLFDGAILNIELAGSAPIDFDFIDVMGNLSVGGPGATMAAAPGVLLNVTNLGGYDPDPALSHDVIQVGGTVTQSATPFNQTATGFDTLDIGFTGNTLGLLVSVTPPPPPPAPPTPPAPTPPAPTPPAPTPPAPTPPAPTPPAPTPPAPTPPAPTPPAPTPPAPADPVVEPPVPEEPVMTPPNDIINDVITFDPVRSEFQRPNLITSDDGQDAEGEEIAVLENQCR